MPKCFAIHEQSAVYIINYFFHKHMVVKDA